MGRSFENRKSAMAKTSNMKAKLYSRYGKEIYMVAKSGGSDPNANLTLKHLCDRAKKEQVPSHVIEKALDKAKGGAGEDYQPTQYEGYGPGGTQFIVDCLTDNLNRTIGDVRNCFTKSKSKLGTPGSVIHSFDHLAVFTFKGDEEAVLEALLMADVDVKDVEAEGDLLTVFAPNNEYNKAKQALMDEFGEIDFEEDGIQYIPHQYAQVQGDDVELFEKLVNMLNDVDDVQNIHHNAEL